jgi:hypothetical protein
MTPPIPSNRSQLVRVGWIVVKVILLVILVRGRAPEFVYAGF